MLSDDPLLDELLRLEELDPKKRGYGLEKLVARMFRRAHFRIELNPGMAKPRQTDLVAEGGGHTFLIETKWTSRRSSVDTIDSLRGRLQNAPSGVIGVLVSISGFSSNAIESVAKRRDRPFLLLDRKDVEETCKRSGDLRRILRNKLDALRLDGDVLVGERPPSRKWRVAANDPVEGDVYLLTRDGARVPWIQGRGGFAGFTFSRRLNDPDWVSASGASVSFDLSLSTGTVPEVAWALCELSSLGWTSGASHWSITQSAANWHGIGPANLIQALLRWEERYRDAGPIHHTEQVVYQDVCDDGFYTIMIDIDASASRQVWRSDMSLQLSGIPIDLDPIRELCRTFDVQARTRFRPRTEPIVKRAWPRREQIEINPIAFLVSEQQDQSLNHRSMVCGLVVKNPYYQNNRRRRALADDMPRPLEETDLLMCDLGSWHQLDRKLKYQLELCEYAETSNALVTRITADWLDTHRSRESVAADRPPRRKQAT